MPDSRRSAPADTPPPPAKLAKTALDFPPMQAGASFNLEAIKQKIQKTLSSRTGN